MQTMDNLIHRFIDIFSELEITSFTSRMSEIFVNISQNMIAKYWKIAQLSQGFKIEFSSRHSSYSFVRLRANSFNKILDAFVHYGADDPLLIESVEFYLQPDPRPEIPSQLKDFNSRLEIVKKRLNLDSQEDRFSGSILIAKGDKIKLQMSVGFADQTHQVPNTMKTSYHLGSCDKMFTAVAIAQLIDSNQIDYQSKLVNLISFPKTSHTEKITISHLLGHKSGLGGLFERSKYQRDHKYNSHSEYLPIFEEEPLRFEPGAQWGYSNEGYIVLGAIIEEITGYSYYEYVKNHIFSRCGMTNTSYDDLDIVIKNRANGYLRDQSDTFGIEPRKSNIFFVSRHGNACGGVYSTAEDMFKFLLNFKAAKLCSQARINELTEKKQLFDPQKNTYYGYGFQIREFQGKTIIGHGGGGPNSGINSEILVGWEDDVYVSVLGNYDAPISSIIANEAMEIMIS